MRKVLPFIALPLLLAVAGCSEISEQISGSIESTATNAIEKGIQDELAKHGVELDGTPNCSTDMSQEGLELSGTADCDATTLDGQDATATFDGTLSGSGCSGSVTVVVEGETVVEGQEIPNCSVSL